MKTMTTNYTTQFMNDKPTIVQEYTNQLDQKVTILEHPNLGCDACLYALIDGVLCSTGFYDCEDFTITLRGQEHITEYMPVLVEGFIYCAFEEGF